MEWLHSQVGNGCRVEIIAGAIEIDYRFVVGQTKGVSSWIYVIKGRP